MGTWAFLKHETMRCDSPHRASWCAHKTRWSGYNSKWPLFGGGSIEIDGRND